MSLVVKEIDGEHPSRERPFFFVDVAEVRVIRVQVFRGQRPCPVQYFIIQLFLRGPELVEIAEKIDPYPPRGVGTVPEPFDPGYVAVVDVFSVPCIDLKKAPMSFLLSASGMAAHFS
jgi:hypothetical protein